MALKKYWIVPANTWLVVILLFYVALWLMCPQEFIPSDPWYYSKRSFAIIQGLGFGDNYIFSHRLGVTVPVAVIYSLFGADILTTNLWPLCTALMVIVIVWLALPDQKSKIIGALLCLTSVPLLKNSVTLFPDLIATPFMAFSSLLLFRRKQGMGQGFWLAMPLLAIASLFFAFLAKESAYWVLPLWFFALFSDRKDHDFALLLRRFYWPVVCAGAVLGVSYLVFCQFVWGSPLAHFQAVQNLTGAHQWSWDKATAMVLAKRLTIDPVILFIRQYGGILSMTVLGGLFAPKSIKPWVYYTVCCVMFFWFGSTSFTRYEPMPIFERMTVPALPGFYILAAYALANIAVPSDRKLIKLLCPVLILFGLSGIPFFEYLNSWKHEELLETKAMSMVQKEVALHPDQKYLLIASDKRSPESMAFYFGMKYPDNFKVVYGLDLTEQLLADDIKEAFLFISIQRSKYLESQYHEPNIDKEIYRLGLTPLFQSDEVVLFKTSDKAQLRTLMQRGD